MALYLRSLADIDAALLQQIVEIYKADFGEDFRRRMDGCITNLDWNQLNDSNLRDKLLQKVREVFTREGDKALVKKIEGSLQSYAQKFKACINEEDAKYSAKKSKQKSRPKVSTSSEASVAATVPKRSRPAPPANSESIPPALYMSLIKGNTLEQLISELQNHCETLVAWQSLGEPNNQVFSYWCETAPKILDCAKQIHSSIADCLFAWDKRKRRLANQFEHNDERFDFRDDQFDQAAFDRVRSVYVEEVNTIENQAQKTVSCLYGVIDSAARWRSYYQNYQGLQVHLQIQEASNVEQKARQLIIELAKTTFIVWRQSEQVIKAGNKFKATVRLLVGPALRLDAAEPTVSVEMLTAEMLKTNGTANVASGRPARVQVTSSPGTVTLKTILRPTEYDVTVMRTGPAGRKDVRASPKVGYAQQKSLLAEFSDITWKNEDKRSANKDELTVCELKYAAVFQTTINLLGETVTLRCWSLPLILIVHASQECKAHGTIFWDNAFSEKRREPFAAPEEVSWYKFSRQFFRWFAWQTHTSVDAIAPHNVDFIQTCLGEPSSDRSLFKVTLRRFYRDKSAEPLKFNFCDWIFGVRKLVTEDAFLQFLWQRGAVYGFTTHDTGMKLLTMHTYQLGNMSMLLRFSTSPVYNKKGAQHVGLVMMICNTSPLNEFTVLSLMPATLEDLKGTADLRERMLAEKVTREYLYPSIAWKNTLLREFDETLKKREENSSGSAEHYTKVAFSLVISDEGLTGTVDVADDRLCLIASVDAEALSNLVPQELIQSFDDRMTLSNTSAFSFSNIQTCSETGDLSNIEATFPSA